VQPFVQLARQKMVGSKLGKREITDEDRGQMNALFQAGFSKRDIARRVGRDEKTVRRHLAQPDPTKRKKRPGRPRKITDRDARHVFRLAIVKKMSCNKIAAALETKPSKSTVVRALRNHEFAKYSKRKPAPALKPHHRLARLTFAAKHRNKRFFWRRVLFTDEKKFNLDGPDGFGFYWHHVKAKPEFYSKRVSGGGSVMVWAGVGWHGNTEIVFLTGKQDSIKYQQTLSDAMLPTLQELKLKLGDKSPIFQQDNASIHSSRSTNDFLRREGVHVLSWPSKSPDLNIIENVWGLLARNVYENGQQFECVRDLKAKIKAEWAKLEPKYIRKLVNSMASRLMCVECAKGGPTKY
jgi:transposase